MRMVNIGEAKTNLSRLIRQVEQGEEVIIARDGEAVVKLVRVDVDRRPREPGLFKGQIAISDDFDAPLPPEIGEHFA